MRIAYLTSHTNSNFATQLLSQNMNDTHVGDGKSFWIPWRPAVKLEEALPCRNAEVYDNARDRLQCVLWRRKLEDVRRRVEDQYETVKEMLYAGKSSGDVQEALVVLKRLYEEKAICQAGVLP